MIEELKQQHEDYIKEAFSFIGFDPGDNITLRFFPEENPTMVEWEIDSKQLLGVYEIGSKENARRSVIFTVTIRESEYFGQILDVINLSRNVAHKDEKRNNIFELVCRYLIVKALWEKVGNIHHYVLTCLNYEKNLDELNGKARKNG